MTFMVVSDRRDVEYNPDQWKLSWDIWERQQNPRMDSLILVKNILSTSVVITLKQLNGYYHEYLYRGSINFT